MSPVFQIAALLVLAGAVSVGAAKTKWNYNDPWGGTCQSGRQQSPIDLDSSRSLSAQYERLAFINYDETLPMKIVNNGHTVQYNIDHPKATVMASGGLPGIYYFAQMHFHWGSEHTVKGQRYPLEVHLVHYEKSYLDLNEAKTQSDAIAVVGILFKESADNNTDLDPLLETLEQVNGVVDREFPVQLMPEILFPSNIDKFYRYRGSLTTPTCDETVIWTVMSTYVLISKSQYKRFQAIRVESGAPMGNNFRPTQALNGRTVSATMMAPGSNAFTVMPASPVLAGALLALYTHYHL